jgi:hypothetical protein
MTVKLPEKIKSVVRPLYYFFLLKRLQWIAWRHSTRITNYLDIPIIINSYNRLSCLKLLIDALEKRGYFNIYILDNASTYPPLLDYYKTCKHEVIYLGENFGYLSLWKSPVRKRFIFDYFVYTDPDIVPIEECPANFLEIFWNKLKSDNSICKVGFSLRIDDLPAHYVHRQKVIDFEQQYYEKRVDDFFYEANIDTTFALYRPGLERGANLYLKMYRSAYPLQARHTPWYANGANPTEEEVFYVQNAVTSTHWTDLNKQ